MVARRSQWVFVKQDPNESPRDQSEPPEEPLTSRTESNDSIGAHDDEIDPLATNHSDDSDSSSVSNSELAAPLADIIEKQRRMSESAQLLTGSEQSRPRPEPEAPRSNNLAVFVVGFVLGFYVRGWFV